MKCKLLAFQALVSCWVNVLQVLGAKSSSFLFDLAFLGTSDLIAAYFCGFEIQFL